MVFACGLPFPQEMDTSMSVLDSIRTLLGPRPHLDPSLGSGGSGFPRDIEAQKSQLTAYRAKISALIEILEGGVRIPGWNEAITGPAGLRLSGPRKPVAGARAARKRHAA